MLLLLFIWVLAFLGTPGQSCQSCLSLKRNNSLLIFFCFLNTYFLSDVYFLPCADFSFCLFF